MIKTDHGIYIPAEEGNLTLTTPKDEPTTQELLLNESG